MSLLRLAVVGLLAVGLVYVVLWDIRTPQVTFLKAFLLAQLPAILTVAAVAWRSVAVTRGAVPFPVSVRANGMTVGASLFLPARLGELGKPYYFFRVCGYPKKAGLAAVVKERVWDVVGLAAVTVVLLFALGQSADRAVLATPAKGLALLGGAGLLILLVLPRIGAHRLPFARFTVHFTEVLGGDRVPQICLYFSISVLIWILSFAILVVAYGASGLPPLTPLQLAFLFVVSTLGLVIAVTPGGIGPYEGSIAALLVGYGLDWETGLSFAIGFRLTWMAAPLSVALVALAIDGKQLFERREGAA
jgi:hypothetical protein